MDVLYQFEKQKFLTLKVVITTAADDILYPYFFLYFPVKISIDIHVNCLSGRQFT